MFLVSCKLFISICWSIRAISTSSCPIKDEYEAGNEVGVHLKLYECTKYGALQSWYCGNVLREYELTKGVLTNLKGSYNMYDVMAKYTGRYTCISWRYRDRSSGYYTDAQYDEKCKEACFSNYDHATYWMETYCDDKGVCSHSFKSIKLEATPKSATGNSKTCPMHKVGKSGDIERARIDVWDCIKALSSTDYACAGKPVKSKILLKKGEVTNLNYDVNEYPVLAKFYGDETCASWRYLNERTNQYSCSEKCWSIHEDDGTETEQYKTDIKCYTRCVGSRQSLRFVVTADGNVVKSLSLLVTVLFLFIAKLITE